MKILFIPLGMGMKSLGHLIPLLSLASKIRDTGHKTAFLLLRLEDLGVNCHLTPPNNGEDSLVLFKTLFEKYANPSDSFYKSAVQKLAALKEETKRVMASFNFEQVLEKAME